MMLARVASFPEHGLMVLALQVHGQPVLVCGCDVTHGTFEHRLRLTSRLGLVLLSSDVNPQLFLCTTSHHAQVTTELVSFYSVLGLISSPCVLFSTNMNLER